MSDPPPINICLFQFLTRFFIDIGKFSNLFFTIGPKIEKNVIPTYDENAPTNTLSSIAEDFRNCIEPKVGEAAIITATQLADAIFYIVILTAIFMILVVVIFSLLDRQKQGGIIIALILFFALIYIVVGWMLIHNSFLIISNQITEVEQFTDKCVTQAIAATELFFVNQENAIDLALCSYPIEVPVTDNSS
jgi:hypothetical protein